MSSFWGAFLLVTVLVGGKTGAKSILGLAMTVAVLVCLLIPLLLKGWPTIWTTFLLCSYVAVVCFVILGAQTGKFCAPAWGLWREWPWPRCLVWPPRHWPM